jgi:1-acyl-sn-glycerol-3-phosphate acyltransferase
MSSVAVPTRTDLAIAKVAGFIARSVYRDIDIHWTSPPQTNGAELTVANHFGGVADALLLLYAMPRPPGIIARDVIWRVPVVGRLMNVIGAIPVHKPEDGGPTSNNDQMFASCYAALRAGRHLLIFPEGVTRNEPSIAAVKTGAARIVLGAQATGATGISITPVGIHYEDKAALRSRVVINVGRALDVDHEVARLRAEEPRDDPITANDRAAVDALTEGIEVVLRRAAPDYASWAEANALTEAAEIALRSELDDPRGPVPIGLRDRLANVLAEHPPARRTEICAAVSNYHLHLEGLGVTDADVHGRSRLFRFAASVLVQLIVGLLLLPFAVVGAIANVVPYLIVKAVGLRPVAPSMQATVKPIVAVVAFGITWAILIWIAVRAWGIEAAPAAIVLLPVYLAATMLFIERMYLLWGAIRRQRRGGRVTDHPARLIEERATVVEAVWRR